MRERFSSYHGISVQIKERTLCILRFRQPISDDVTTMASGSPKINMKVDDSQNRSLSMANEDKTSQNGDLCKPTTTVYTYVAMTAHTYAE